MAKNNNICGGLYTLKVMKTFKNPHNYGKIKNADGTGKVGNIVCGDVMHLYINVGQNKKKQDFIKDIKFETFGCVAAISTSSIITDLAKGKTIKEINAKSLKTVKQSITSSKSTDVTGGMLHKVQKSLDLAKNEKIQTVIINGNRKGELEKAVFGEEVKGTIIS